MRCWNGWQIILSFVFLIDIRAIIKSPSTLTIKVRQLSHAHTELMHIVECLLGCVMLLLLFNDA